MKFLLDQNLSPRTTIFLKTLGFNAVDVRDVGLAGKSDEEIYEYALQQKLVIITFDHEFGYKYISRQDLEGLILLRLHPQTLEIVHDSLKQLFSTVSTTKMRQSITVVELGRFRIRKMPAGK